MFSIKSL